MDSQTQKDTQRPCKYGSKCYQKNPAHHAKYKHPKNTEIKGRILKRKFNSIKNKVSVTNNVSDSDSSTKSDIPKGSGNDIEETVSDETTKTQKVNNDVSESDSESTDDTNKHFEETTNDISLNSNTDNEIKEVNQYNNVELKDTSNIQEDSVERDPKRRKLDTEDTKTNEQQWSHFIQEKFLVTMPEDFYTFWYFCQELKPNNPCESFKDVGLTLVGPYDVLAGKFNNKNVSPSDYLIHWRYYRDPPEFQTVLKGDSNTGYHIGYFRDTPRELPVFLASNSSKKDGILKQMGENIFSAVNIYLEESKKNGSPFIKIAIRKLQSALTKAAEKRNIDLAKKTKKIIAREKKIVTRTFNKIGLVVPYDKKTELGYRALAMENKKLEALLTKLQNSTKKEEKDSYLSELQPVFTYASIAADECDFGTGIELGWNIICHGIKSLNLTAERFLISNYKLLKREEFAKIAEAHMQNRKEDLNLSVV